MTGLHQGRYNKFRAKFRLFKSAKKEKVKSLNHINVKNVLVLGLDLFLGLLDWPGYWEAQTLGSRMDPSYI